MDVRVSEFGEDDARERFAELIDRVQAGEEIVIKRDGRAIARLAPAQPTPSSIDGWDGWFAFRDAQRLTLGAEVTLRDLLQDTRGA